MSDADRARKPADVEPDMTDYETDGQESGGEQPLGRDDRVSLWPLSFEDVVRALHKTPAAQRRGNQEPPDDDPEPADG